MSELTRVSVVLPSLDPDEKLREVIEGMLKVGFADIILVNDGSKAENTHYFDSIAEAHPEVHLLQHEVNKGKGAALKTAFDWFLNNRPEGIGVVTVDGDNQHRPEDTLACVRKMLQERQVVLGVRDFSLPHVPPRSRFGNRVTSAVFRLFCGMKISDTQTGLRAIPREDLKILREISGERFEYETNMLLAMQKNDIPFHEVKCETVYIEENKSSHFRVIRDSWRIYKLLLTYFLRYTMSSLVSAVVDEGLFTFLTWILQGSVTGLLFTAIPVTVARVVSSLLNFNMNRRLVFKSRVNLGTSLLKYYMLAVPQLLLQLFLTHGICVLFQIGEERTVLRAIIYGVVMTVLFVCSYMIQQRWVFRGRQKETDK